MLGNNPPKHNDIIKKLTILFGSLFTDIKINRDNSEKGVEQLIKVPLSYGPADKTLARVLQQPELETPFAISLPRMAFEFIDMQYDPNRAINPMNRVQTGPYVAWAPKPYNFIFELYIMANTLVDATRILETIVPHFSPQFNVPGKLVSEMEVGQDLAITLLETSKEDDYTGQFEQRRTLIWTLRFNIAGWLWGHITDTREDDSGIIKKVEVNYHAGIAIANKISSTHIWPGSTEANTATTDPHDARPYDEVNVDDNWDFIVEFLGA